MLKNVNFCGIIKASIDLTHRMFTLFNLYWIIARSLFIVKYASLNFVNFVNVYEKYRGDLVFYDRFAYLCKQKDVSPSRAALDAGISKSLVSKWKTNNTAIPSPDVLSKLSRYFGIPVSELLGEEPEKAPAEPGKRSVSDEDIQFALFGGSDEITEKMYDEVKKFAAYVKQREGYNK